MVTVGANDGMTLLTDDAISGVLGTIDNRARLITSYSSYTPEIRARVRSVIPLRAAQSGGARQKAREIAGGAS
jgi:hypothetical protein